MPTVYYMYSRAIYQGLSRVFSFTLFMHVWEALLCCSLISFWDDKTNTTFHNKFGALRQAMTDFLNKRRMFAGCLLLCISYSQDSSVDHREKRALAPLPSLDASLSRGERPQQWFMEAIWGCRSTTCGWYLLLYLASHYLICHGVHIATLFPINPLQKGAGWIEFLHVLSCDGIR